LKAVAAPLAGLRFCPTGGIGAETAPAYLALANVACVGGSWVAPREAVLAQDWSHVERLAAAAARYKRF
jgi:2-dehydro-3-deoxyphosphogluconate aldolase / (4S)-4-hydroxy-2-oxoglutarate aldolase